MCYKKFTRKWHLERHLYGVHEVHDDLRRKARIKQEEEIYVPYHLPNLVEPKRKFLNKNTNMNQSPQYNQTYYYNNNNLPNNFPYYYYGYYNNGSSYPYYSNINSQYKEEEEKKLSIDDKIKIQTGLKI
jgi:hypothetical protein